MVVILGKEVVRHRHVGMCCLLGRLLGSAVGDCWKLLMDWKSNRNLLLQIRLRVRVCVRVFSFFVLSNLCVERFS